MAARIKILSLALALVPFVARAESPVPADADLAEGFTKTVKPFLNSYCVKCHSGEKPKADFDLAGFSSVETIIADQPHWALVLEKLTAKEMPPAEAKDQPTKESREQVIEWITALRTSEATKNAGDPGTVLARRLSNAEFNYTIRDLTGVDMRPTREFPLDPANPAGFDNSGESLAMSPALMTKYLAAAREVADHLVLKPSGLAFAPYPMLVETDRDKYCVAQIVDFYHRQNTDYKDYFLAAWQFKHREALGKPNATLADIAAENKVSAKYLATVSYFLEEEQEDVGPTASLQKTWRELPAPEAGKTDAAVADCKKMRDFVVELRKKVEPRFPNLAAGKVGASSQPMLMWKNHQYASHRMTFDRSALQVAGEEKKVAQDEPAADPEPGADNEFGPGRTMPVKNKAGDPDLVVPAGQRPRYEESFAKFCAVFPDAFYIEERGRNYLDKTKDRGRLLSAGFHNLMGYFRDDTPLSELVLNEKGQKELDELWQELDFVASGNIRTYVQFYLNESGEAREGGKSADGAATTPEDKEITSEARIKKVAANYLAKAKGASDVAIKAVEDHFNWVNAGIRWVEKARSEAEPIHLQALVDFAARAYRRALTDAEREEILANYRALRDKAGLDHETAMRDSIVGIVMSPDFCYRIDLVDEGEGVRPLSDAALASRLSYFLWSSMPDDDLLACAAAGKLHEPSVMAQQARRMLGDARTRALAVEFGGNWLGFRQFEEINTVDRERFPSFTNDLRQAMFEEPVRFLMDVFQNDRSVLDTLYARHTYVNPVLAKHYGMPEVKGGADEWVRVDDANKYGRGGILPMAAFLTKNAPGLRTSPVKRGYWVVKNVLGERIPPPPAAVPELPRDEAKLDLPLRDMLARHRQDPSCSACHTRFDSMGLVFEGFGPIGERRDTDLAGHAVDAHAVFPGGSEGTGFDGLRQYLKDCRQNDFVDNLCRKLLSYALGRSLMLSDEPTVREMRDNLVKNDYRFDNLVVSIVNSPQFLNKRAAEHVAATSKP
jgi:Protein of unknown function (DUF1592)/Protein of unknown function (DUF1588)/Protein of unknown function (DUF1587)/Protein of unknown function (DUF1585)/Protein of unknown function (DUF1595)